MPLQYSLSFGEKVAETSEAVLELLRHCVSPKTKTPLAKNGWPVTGLPFSIYGDAGKAFNCRAVKHFLAQIKCNYITTETKSPWKKPFIESFNRTLRSQFARTLPGYSRNNQEDNKEKSVQEIATLTLSDFINVLEVYILDHYHQNPHRGLFGNTPARECEEALESHCPRMIPDLSKIDHVGGFEHEGVIQGCQGIQKNNLYYQSEHLNNLRLELHKMGSKGNPKVSYIYSTKDVSKITVVSDLTGELISVPCTNPRVESGMSLASYKKLTGSSRTQNNKTKPFTAKNEVVTDAIRKKAYEELEVARNKREAAKKSAARKLSNKGKSSKRKQTNTVSRSGRNVSDMPKVTSTPVPQTLSMPQTI